MFDLINQMMQKISNSEFVIKLKEIVANFLDSFGAIKAKESVDSFINKNEQNVSDSAFGNATKNAKRGWNRIFSKVKESKAANGFTRFLCILMSLGFGAICVYVAVKILPQVLLMVALATSTLVLTEVILSILNKAISPSAKAEAKAFEEDLKKQEENINVEVAM